MVSVKYNIFFTSLPVIALGVFDQDVAARLCLRFPLLYQEGIQNLLFRWRRIIGWMVKTVKLLNTRLLEQPCTCVVWVAIVIWGGIALCYISLFIYGTMSTTFSILRDHHDIGGHFSSNSILYIQRYGSSPWVRYKGRSDDPEFFRQVVRQRSIRPTTVGFTAQEPFGRQRKRGAVAKDNTYILSKTKLLDLQKPFCLSRNLLTCTCFPELVTDIEATTSGSSWLKNYTTSIPCLEWAKMPHDFVNFVNW